MLTVDLSLTELQLGELVHHQKLFGLFEAMSAIEMMDPKMDAGMCCNKNPGGPLTFETAVNVRDYDHFVVDAQHFRTLFWFDRFFFWTLWLLDAENEVDFIRAERTDWNNGWYFCVLGFMVRRSFFGSNNVHLPVLTSATQYWRQNAARVLLCDAQDDTNYTEICTAVSRMICLWVASMTQHIGFPIFSSKVFEEEDFDPRDYGYVLMPDVVNTKACFMLKEAEDELAKQLKSNPDAAEVSFSDKLVKSNHRRPLLTVLLSLLLIETLSIQWPRLIHCNVRWDHYEV